MYRVLVPIDGSEERAAAQSKMVASLPGADESVEATLLRVFDDRQTAESTSVGQLTAGQVAEDALLNAGVSVETRSTYGDPAEEILRVADEIDAELIVLGGRKRSPLGSFLFGSVSQAVTIDASRPVVVTGDEAERTETTSGGERASTS
jgi:nucleotide-binding universal stress UspA family protein